MTSSSADVVICGAGLGGISAAYYLAVVEGITDIVIVDERPPLTLTSDKSTECYLSKLVARAWKYHGSLHEPQHRSA
jgi:glycine/D-amino acid oxidase-like deaminating enzyme